MHDAASDRLLVNLTLQAAEEVKGFPNLLKQEPGSTVEISLPAAVARSEKLQPGEVLRLPVKLARGPKLFAHPDWRPGAPHPFC